MDQYILVVDDWNISENLPAWGTDAARSAFYDSILSGYARDRVEWEPSEHPLEGSPQPPNVDALRGASTCLWYCDGDGSALSRAFNAATYNAIAGYVRVGGNLILEGRQSIKEILDEAYPITITARDTTVADVFVKNTLHVRTAVSSGAGSNPGSSSWTYGFCFYGAIPTDPGMFTPMYIDSLGKYWVMYNKPAPYRHCGLGYTERLGVNQGVGVVPFEIDSFVNMTFQDQPCGVLYLSGDNHGNVCYLTFPLYFMKTFQVRPVVDKLLRLFGEEKLPGR
jgi:hypothetical protein